MFDQFDHIGYPKRLKKLDEQSLRSIIKDCQEAQQANPDATKCRNGYYADEICYAGMELRRRGLK